MAETTYNYKSIKQGVEHMCKSIEDYIKKYAEEYAEKERMNERTEIIKKFIKKGLVSNEEIAETTDMPLDEIQKIAATI